MEEKDEFHPDPLLPFLFRGEEDQFFALGLVVNWPMINDDSFQKQYSSFLSAMKLKCFQKHNECFFCLPIHSLHITVASLFQAKKIHELPSLETKTTRNINISASDDTADAWQEHFIQQWKEVLLQATTLDDWPKQPLKLQLDTARIDPGAVILLWKDSTGGIKQMRQCILKTIQTLHPHLQKYLKIPNIIHTTFVRYIQHQHPPHCSQSQPLRPSQMQAILSNEILPFSPLFRSTESESNTSNTNSPMIIDCAKLVNVKIYLQGPNGEKDHPVHLKLRLSF